MGDAPENGVNQESEPTAQQVLSVMDTCEPYTVSDLQDIFSDTSRWTIQRRLDTLAEQEVLSKKKHAKNRVSYYISSD